MRGIMKTVSGETIRIECQKPGPKPLPESIKRKPVNITLAPYWHKTGQKIAAQRGSSFSRHVENLISKDSMRMESFE